MSFALHVFYDNLTAKASAEDFLGRHFEVENTGKIPTRKTKDMGESPLIWRYFVTPRRFKLQESELDEKEFAARCVFHINGGIKALTFSHPVRTWMRLRAWAFRRTSEDEFEKDTAILCCIRLPSITGRLFL